MPTRDDRLRVERLEKDGEAIRRMLTCGNPAEITAIQSRWVEETLRDYAAEMTRMMEIFARSARGGVPPSGS